jgi:hypothetical protein
MVALWPLFNVAVACDDGGSIAFNQKKPLKWTRSWRGGGGETTANGEKIKSEEMTSKRMSNQPSLYFSRAISAISRKAGVVTADNQLRAHRTPYRCTSLARGHHAVKSYRGERWTWQRRLAKLAYRNGRRRRQRSGGKYVGHATLAAPSRPLLSLSIIFSLSALRRLRRRRTSTWTRQPKSSAIFLSTSVVNHQGKKRRPIFFAAASAAKRHYSAWCW